MKSKNIILLLAALLIAGVSGHPLGLGLQENRTSERVLLPYLENRIDAHRKRIGLFSEGVVSTTTGFATGLGSIFTTGNFQDPLICIGCKAAVDALRFQVKLGNEKGISPTVENTCILLDIQSKDVCKGIAKNFVPELVPILNSTVESLLICSFLLTRNCTHVQLPEWEIPVPEPKTETANPWVEPPANAPKLKVLHLTDTHYDRSYLIGAKATCREPLCCRVQNGLASGKEKGAGKWGDWNCDIPERTLDNMLEHASTTHPDIDYIIFTGDIPAHDIWNQTHEANLEILRDTVAKVKRYFPRTPVYPSVGNHEAAPTDIFPYPGAARSASWLYDELDKEWSSWLPRNTSETIKYGGFYTVLVKPGFRIVSLNTNYCYHRNWWLMINSTDPAGQLQWFVDVLQKAENAKEKVHVIAHIPPGQKDCLPVWRDNYYRIVSRFRNTVVNHFFGHTHTDEYEMYYDDETEKLPVGYGFISPSVTTFTNLNPGYRIFYVDGDHDSTNRVVVDYENWVLDLERANEKDETVWSKSYSAKEEFQLKSLSPTEWDNFYKKLKTDNELLQRYYKRSYKDSPKRKTPCDSKCKKEILCTIRSCQKYD